MLGFVKNFSVQLIVFLDQVLLLAELVGKFKFLKNSFMARWFHETELPLHELKTHQRVMHYSGRAIMSESHKIGRNWIVYLMERCNIVKVLRYKTENMGIELQILFHSSLLLSNRFMPTNISLPYNFTLRWILLSQIIHKSLYLSTQE